MIDKARTIWELWNGDTANPAMNSGNHVMLLGDVLIWLYEDLAGIKESPRKHSIQKATDGAKIPGRSPPRESDLQVGPRRHPQRVEKR